ncbi:hypothetical protein GALL_339430 [mine drainage metagenome]|uniref:Uncharacterized protein n=1 Tax=mine drainage metagenome TaxID=410659 RepID=A0A1J5QWT3_9ZZZZ
MRRGSFVEINDGQKIFGRVFIVERKHFMDVVKAVNLIYSGLGHAMERLKVVDAEYFVN